MSRVPSDAVAVLVGALCAGGMTLTYILGRLAGARWMGEQIRDVAVGVIRLNYPDGNVPAGTANPVAVMCETLDALVNNINHALKEKNHGK